MKPHTWAACVKEAQARKCSKESCGGPSGSTGATESKKGSESGELELGAKDGEGQAKEPQKGQGAARSRRIRLAEKTR